MPLHVIKCHYCVRRSYPCRTWSVYSFVYLYNYLFCSDANWPGAISCSASINVRKCTITHTHTHSWSLLLSCTFLMWIFSCLFFPRCTHILCICGPWSCHGQLWFELTMQTHLKSPTHTGCECDHPSFHALIVRVIPNAPLGDEIDMGRNGWVRHFWGIFGNFFSPLLMYISFATRIFLVQC